MNNIKKIVFFDLDETLLTTDKHVTEENRKAIAEAVEAGNAAAICTGRSVEATLFVAEEAGMMREGCFLVNFQGGSIYDCGSRKVLSQEGIPLPEGRELVQRALDSGLYAQTYGEGGVLIPYECDISRRYCAICRENFRVFSSVEDIKEDLPKVIVINFDERERLDRFQAENAAFAGGKFESFFSNPWYLEYTKKGIDKGYGVRKLAEYLSVPVENTVAVGDERNDIPMICAAGVGAAMVNGHPEVKEAADYITSADNNHSGVAEVIHRFVL